MENNVSIVRAEDSQMSVFGSSSNFDTAQRMAKALCSSTIVPTAYQGTNNLANCIIALDIANRLNSNPLMIMQNLYVVHGMPSFSSKFLIACLNNCGKFSPIRYEFKGKEGSDDWSCRASAVDKQGEILYGAWVSIKMAKSEGWFSKNGSKWQTMPELMLQYRAAAFFQRVYAPEISMGLITREEFDDGVIIEDGIQSAPVTEDGGAIPADNKESLGIDGKNAAGSEETAAPGNGQGGDEQSQQGEGNGTNKGNDAPEPTPAPTKAPLGKQPTPSIFND